ncbi:Tyrosine--tRNA ligase [compost metagenome]
MVLAELCATNGEARRHIEGGAVRINDEPATDPRMIINASSLNEQGVIKVSLGKKRHVLIRPA